MSTLTSRLRLFKHTVADRFKTSDYAANWDSLDASPGTFICTSTTRPSDWAAAQTGRPIYETDTDLTYTWNGTGWARRGPKGLAARGERLTLISTTAFSYSTVIAAPSTLYSVRRHLVVVEAPRVYSTAGVTGLAIFRDTTMLQEWTSLGGTGALAPDQARPLALTTTDQWAGGTAVYSLQFMAVVGFGGTCYVDGATNKPCAISVVEV